jgi:hypothetical protein
MTSITPQTYSGHLRSLWFGLLAGPIAWSIYFLVGYGLTEFVCKLGQLEFRIWGLAALSAIIMGLTLVALLVTLYAGFLAYRNWQRVKEDEPEEVQPSPPEENSRFLALVGLLLSGLFSLVILLTGIPTFFLSPC